MAMEMSGDKASARAESGATASAAHASDHDTDHASGAHDSGSHGASAAGGHGHEDEEELGAFDVVAWTFGAAGVVIALIMWACFAIATTPL